MATKEYLIQILKENKVFEEGEFTLASGKKVKAICVYHPSTGYDWAFWNKVISRFL